MVNAAVTFTQTTNVVNGFSDLILSLYGSQIGMHARSTIGVQTVGGSKFTSNHTHTYTDGRGTLYRIVGRTEIKKKRNESTVLTAYSQIINDEVQGLYVVMQTSGRYHENRE